MFLYRDYIQSEDWQKRRLQALKRDGFRCQMCGSGINLRVHHISYDHLSQDEEIDDLITLCDNCHSQVHEQDIAKKQLSLFDSKEQVLIPEKQRNNTLLLLAIRLLKTEERVQAWSKYQEACLRCEPPLSERGSCKIWLEALKAIYPL